MFVHGLALAKLVDKPKVLLIVNGVHKHAYLIALFSASTFSYYLVHLKFYLS